MQEIARGVRWLAIEVGTVCVWLALALPLVYWLKSALGIDILDIPSPFHDTLYWH